MLKAVVDPTVVDLETQIAIESDVEKAAQIEKTLFEARHRGLDLFDGYSYRAQPDTASILLSEKAEEALQESLERASIKEGHAVDAAMEKSSTPSELDQHATGSSVAESAETTSEIDIEASGEADWDLLENADMPMERNGVHRRGRSAFDNLWSRGVKDQYTMKLPSRRNDNQSSSGTFDNQATIRSSTSMFSSLASRHSSQKKSFGSSALATLRRKSHSGAPFFAKENALPDDTAELDGLHQSAKGGTSGSEHILEFATRGRRSISVRKDLFSIFKPT